jgi:hypothetical protein
MNKWIEYNGDYSKEYYDVKVEGGFIYEQCYPSAGVFYATNGKEIPEYEITHIKKTKAPKS